MPWYLASGGRSVSATIDELYNRRGTMRTIAFVQRPDHEIFGGWD